jgi:hypothetical protein
MRTPSGFDLLREYVTRHITHEIKPAIFRPTNYSSVVTSAHARHDTFLEFGASNFEVLVGLDDVARLEILEVVETDATFEALADFAGVVLEATQ